MVFFMAFIAGSELLLTTSGWSALSWEGNHDNTQ
jgi:hypothetical protein